MDRSCGCFPDGGLAGRRRGGPRYHAGACAAPPGVVDRPISGVVCVEY
ncbi:hypothetical protein BMAPRL20_1475 [Burkholderia mallei PRL-20]|nr:hypothetical protein BMAPRL20_1475 [Burkholderia mallei PRL-20]